MQNPIFTYPVFLTLVFVLLKCLNAVSWSWWWIFSPLIGVISLFILTGLLLLLVIGGIFWYSMGAEGFK